VTLRLAYVSCFQMSLACRCVPLGWRSPSQVALSLCLLRRLGAVMLCALSRGGPWETTQLEDAGGVPKESIYSIYVHIW